MATRPSFTHWLLTQTDRDDVVGELAREVHADVATPLATVARLRDHLISRFAYDRPDTVAALAALDQAAAEFEALAPNGAEAAPRSAGSGRFRD